MTARDTHKVAPAAPHGSARREMDIQAVVADARSKVDVPYPGLRAFRQDESRLFFGRDGCVDQMVDKLAKTRFLAVLGSSGSGKSSLVRTGLYDGLKLGLHPEGGRWQIAEFNPGRKPIVNLARALLGSGAENQENVDLLATHLKRGPRAIAEVARSGIIRDGFNLLISCDQFEELFRFRGYAEREETEAFGALLLETTRADLPIHVTITMRSEFLGACAQIPNLAESISSGLFLIPRLARAECRRAIEGPAHVCHFTLKEDLVARLLNDLQTFSPFEGVRDADQTDILAQQADQLPLMQHVLNRIWRRAMQERGREHLVLELSDYDNAGGLNGAINAHGAEIMHGLEQSRGPQIRKRVERVFRVLVEGPTLALAVRRPRRVEELIAAGDGETARGDVLAAIDAFRTDECNFLRTSDLVLDDSVVVDIVHESLIRRWDLLSGWFKAELETQRLWQRLADLAEDHKPPLNPAWMSGSALQRFSEWWHQDQPLPFSAERYGKNYDQLGEFLKGSEAEAARIARQSAMQRQHRAIGIAAGAISIVAIILAAGAYNIQFLSTQRNELAAATNSLIKKALQAQQVTGYYVDLLCDNAAAEEKKICIDSYSRQVDQLFPLTNLPTQEANGTGGADPSQVVVYGPRGQTPQ